MTNLKFGFTLFNCIINIPVLLIALLCILQLRLFLLQLCLSMFESETLMLSTRYWATDKSQLYVFSKIYVDLLTTSWFPYSYFSSFLILYHLYVTSFLFSLQNNSWIKYPNPSHKLIFYGVCNLFTSYPFTLVVLLIVQYTSAEP